MKIYLNQNKMFKYLILRLLLSFIDCYCFLDNSF